MGQNPCVMLSTPCRVHARRIEAFLRAKGGAKGVLLNIRKVFLMFGIFSVFFQIHKFSPFSPFHSGAALKHLAV